MKLNRNKAHRRELIRMFPMRDRTVTQTIDSASYGSSGPRII